MSIGLALLAGLAIGAPIGWAMKTRYLRMLHKTATRIRVIQRGGKVQHRRR